MRRSAEPLVQPPSHTFGEPKAMCWYVWPTEGRRQVRATAETIWHHGCVVVGRMDVESVTAAHGVNRSSTTRVSANGMVRPCSCPASDKLARGAKTRSTPCLRRHRLRLR